jgi:uncharacterized CHY-type Zn-finger protein
MEKELIMTTCKAKELPASIKMSCYACGEMLATHVCRYQVEELRVQVCLCGQCMKMDTEYLIKNTLGIENPSESLSMGYLMV